MILTMRRSSCIRWWNLPILSMDANWFDTKLIKLQPLEGKGVGLSFALMGRWCGKLMRVILLLILLENSILVIITWRKKVESITERYVCLMYLFVTWFHLLNEFVNSMNSFIIWIPFFLYKKLHEFTYVCLYELLGVDTMAPKKAKKCMKASKHKKRKLLQTTMGPTPRKTVSHSAPSIELKCPMQIVIFVGNIIFLYFDQKQS